MLIREENLVRINSKNRIQHILLQLDKNPLYNFITIHRISSQYGGKSVEHPVLKIEQGKVNRTVEEQATLQFNSLLKNYLDSGYVRLINLTSKSYKLLSEQEIKDLLGGDCIKDQKGVPKPMLAKSVDQLSNSIYEQEHYVSRKINGVRCLMYYKDGMILTASRGGGNYNVATQHIRNNEILRKIFVQFPDLILDGELYKHGWPLQKISGVCRKETWEDECSNIEYWIYDYISPQPFKERYETLMSLQELLKNEISIKVIDHYLISGYLMYKRYHDNFVREGFEGLCARNPNKEYGIGKRSGVYLFKMKAYKDAEAKIINIRKGLRPEDLCFILQLQNGKEFAAKPVGNTAIRTYYFNHADEFIGKQGTYKYFELSKDGIPCQPIFLHVRPEDE